MGDPLAALPSVRAAIRRLGGDIPVYNIGTMERRVSSSPSPRRFIAGPLAVVALVASYVPARRAAGGDPMVALRYE